MKKQIVTYSALLFASVLSVTGCKFGKQKNKNADTYEDGRLVLNLKNVYFEGWDGNDSYTKTLEDKFSVKIKPSNYVYDTWDGDVNMEVNAHNMPDVFHYDRLLLSWTSFLK